MGSTAVDQASADPWMLRKKFSVVIEKTARELACTPCLALDEPDPSKEEIYCSRLFGKRLTTVATIVDSVFQPGFKYSKAEVMLLELHQPGMEHAPGIDEPKLYHSAGPVLAGFVSRASGTVKLGKHFLSRCRR